MTLPLRAVAYDETYRDASWAWLQNPELRELTLTPPFTRDDQLRWFASLPRPGYHLWGIEAGGSPAGAFGIKNVADGSGEYWGYLGDATLWGRGSGSWILEQALAAAPRLGLSRLCLRVAATNERAIRLYERNGFHHVGREGNICLMERMVA